VLATRRSGDSMSDSKRQFARFAAIFASGTMLSRVLGLARDIVLGALVPTASLGLFWAAFRLPNMLRDLIGEGATNAAFVPVFSQSRENSDDAQYRGLVAAAYGAMLLLFGVVTTLGVLLLPVTPWIMALLAPITNAQPEDLPGPAEIRLMQWVFPYIFFIGVAAFATAPLFVARHYSTPAWSPTLLNVALIGCLLLFGGYFEEPAWALVVGVWVGGILQMAVLLRAMRRQVGVSLPRLDLRHPGVRRCFRLLTPVLIGQSAGPINKLVNTYFAISLGTSTVAALTYANNLVQLPLSIFGIAVSVAILPSISRAGAAGALGEVRDTLRTGLRQTCFLTLPATVGIVLLSGPLVALLFQHGEFGADTARMTAEAAALYGAGLLAFAWVRVCVQGFYAVQDTTTPVVCAALSMALNIALNFALVGPYGFRGLAVGTSIAYAFNFLLLFALLWRRYGALADLRLLWGIARIALASAVLGLAVAGAYSAARAALPGAGLGVRAVIVALPILAGCAAYAVACVVLRVEEFTQFSSLALRRLQHSGK